MSSSQAKNRYILGDSFTFGWIREDSMASALNYRVFR